MKNRILKIKFLLNIILSIILLLSTLTFLSASKPPDPEKLSDEEFRLHISQGRIYYLKRHYREAIKKWRPLIEHRAFTDNLRSWLNKAYDKVLTAYGLYNQAYDLFYNKQELFKSEESCLEAINIYPNYREAIELLEIIRAARTAKTFLDQAEKHFENGEYDKAIMAAKEALQIQPDNQLAASIIEKSLLKKNNVKVEEEVQALLESGITAFSNQKYNSAKRSFNSALKLDSNNPTAQEYLTRIADIQQKRAEKNLLVEETEKYYKKGKDLYNTTKLSNAREEFLNATALISNYKDSEKHIKMIDEKLLEQELKLKRENEQLAAKYMSQGITEFFKGRYNKSIALLEKARLLDPDNEFILKYLKDAKAVLYQKGSEVITEDSPYYLLYLTIKRKGDYYFYKGEYEESIKWWEKILNLFPVNKVAREMSVIIALKLNKEGTEEFVSTHFSQGKKWLQNREFKNALEEFEMIYKIDPDFPEIKKYIKEAEENMGKPQYIILSRQELKNHYEAGLKYFKQEQFNNAIKEWEKILVDTSPENPYRINAIVNISKVQRKIKFSVSSIEDNRIKPEKENPTAKKHYLKGVAYYIKGRYELAIKEWQAVLKYEPNHAKAKNNIEKCRRKLQFAR